MPATQRAEANLVIFNQKYAVSYHDRTFDSFTRCYRVSDQHQIWHITRLKPLSSLNEAQDTLEAIKQDPEFRGLDAVLYTRQKYLPPDLRRQLLEIPRFREFCKVLALSRKVELMVINGQELPLSVDEHSECRPAYCSGIPITKPATIVQPEISYSFDLLDYRGFLGDYFRFAADPRLSGRMIHLATHGVMGERLAPDPLIDAARKFADILARVNF